VTLLLFCWITFIGAAVVFHANEYIVVEYFINRFLPGYRRHLTIFSDILVIGFLLFIIFEMPGLIATQTHKVEILPLPTYVLSLPILICVFNILLQFIHRLWTSLGSTQQILGREE
jgi:TRAP-type C4-dicarboxylate transport system permease small subunit